MISIIHVYNELGIINDIQKIGEIAYRDRIPFHSDCVRSFGKLKMDPSSVVYRLDGFSASFHKIYGPKGLGLLCLKKNLVDNSSKFFEPIISGTQQNGIREGTENVACIAGARKAWSHIVQNENQKIIEINIHNMKKTILKKLDSYFSYIDYDEKCNLFCGGNHHQ